jgi:hypothetical protein
VANAVYPKAKERALAGGINWSAGDIRVVLIRTSGGDNPYTYGAAHEFLESIHADARVATSGNLGSKSITNGVADAAGVAARTFLDGYAYGSLSMTSYVVD